MVDWDEVQAEGKVLGSVVALVLKQYGIELAGVFLDCFGSFEKGKQRK